MVSRKSYFPSFPAEVGTRKHYFRHTDTRFILFFIFITNKCCYDENVVNIQIDKYSEKI